MKFYRIENSNNIGPYQDSNILDATANARHPMSSDDSLLAAYDICFSFNNNYRFGFYSLEQLHNWFYNNDDFTLMHERDFHLSVYEVPHMFVGNTQCVIRAIDHTVFNKVETISLLTLLQ